MNYLNFTKKNIKTIAYKPPKSFFRNYAGGIFEDETCPQTKSNHAIIGVGYDKIEGNFLKKI